MRAEAVRGEPAKVRWNNTHFGTTNEGTRIAHQDILTSVYKHCKDLAAKVGRVAQVASALVVLRKLLLLLQSRPVNKRRTYSHRGTSECSPLRPSSFPSCFEFSNMGFCRHRTPQYLSHGSTESWNKLDSAILHRCSR